MPMFHPHTNKAPPAMPNPLIPTPARTPAQIHNAVSPSAKWNLYHILEDGVRYEAKLYGYFNTALTEIFPASNHFQVKSLLHQEVSKN